MAATLAGYNEALDRIWTQRFLEEQLFQGNELLEKLEKTTRFKVGEVARVPTHDARNGGYTAMAAGGGTLNTAGEQGVGKAEYNYTNHHMQVAIQGDAIDGTADNSLSVANVVDTEVKGALVDLRRQLTRQLFLNGDALIAQCRTSVSNDIDLELVSGANAIERGWIFVGAQVDIGTSANEIAISDGVTVTAVDETNTAFTVSSGAVTGEGATHFVSNKNSRAGAVSNESNGLRNLVSLTSTFGGATVAANPKWKAANVDTTTQPLTLSLMLQQSQKIQQNCGDEPDFCLTGLKQSRKFYELLQQQIRYANDASLNAGDAAAPKWNGMDIMRHPDCQNEDMYFGRFKNLFLVATDKPYWQNKITGGKTLDWIQGTDSFGGKLTYRFQLATNRRNVFARLGGLS